MLWNEIIRQHGPAAYGAAWRILGHAEDVEDVLQDVFLESHRLYRAGQVDHWGAFLKRLATYRALDRLRQRKTMMSLDQVAPLDARPGPEQQAIARESEQRLRSAVAELSERAAAVFCLFYFEQLGHQEIARTLGITSNAVAVALHKARARLSGLMAEVEQEHPT